MAKVTVTLQRFSPPLQGVTVHNEETLGYLHGKKISLPHVPQPGDFIKDSDTHSGYAEVAKIIYDLNGNITVAIK